MPVLCLCLSIYSHIYELLVKFLFVSGTVKEVEGTMIIRVSNPVFLYPSI